MVKLPSGRILKTLFGGEKSLSEALETLSIGKLDGLIKTSFTRDGEASLGQLVTRKGKPYLAIHDSGAEIFGEEALYEIARDSVNDDCIIEVRSYSYKSSSISVTHLGESHTSGILGEIDVDSTLRIVRDEEKTRIEKSRKEAGEKHMRDMVLKKADEDLTIRDQELETARIEAVARSDDIDRIKAEMETLRSGSVALLKHLTSDKKGLDEEDIIALADRKVEQMRFQARGEELENRA
ncbi:MAG: hypothetical protein KAR56_02600, partial [Thermoplasmata archaeon]|nr:hypothetical protein [Thermoplasmata archaeon]